MRNLLALLAVLVLLFAGVGWYRDWFKVRSEPAASGHRNVNIDIDTHRIGQDLHQGEKKIEQILQNAKDAHGGDAKAPVSIDKSGKDTKAAKDSGRRGDAGSRTATPEGPVAGTIPDR
jgi:hypothetical protein